MDAADAVSGFEAAGAAETGERAPSSGSSAMSLPRRAARKRVRTKLFTVSGCALTSFSSQSRREISL